MNNTDFNASDIISAINIHCHVYRLADKDVPSFRITRYELKCLYKKLKDTIGVPEGAHYDEIMYYLGVPLEVCTLG